MRDLGFQKSERLLKRSEFDKALNGGRRTRVGRMCTLFFLPNGSGSSRLGIIASKKIGNAVVRNRAKRKIREVFRRIKNEIHPAADLVVISGKELADRPLSELRKKIGDALL